MKLPSLRHIALALPAALSFIMGVACMGVACMGVANAQPVCSITGPDSIFFDTATWNRYLPGSFTVSVTVVNPDPTAVDSLVAFARSNTRFTVLPPAALLVAPSLGPGDTVRAEFTLVVNPREASGMDTIAVSLSGKAGRRAECLLPVWVEKEYRPVNEIVCPPGSLLGVAFVDTLNAYRPDPLPVPLTITNNGDAPSSATRLFIVATPGVAPADGQNPVVELGTLAPGARVQPTVLLRVVRRPDDTVVTLHFRVQGQGGLGDRIIDTLCAVPLGIPAARDAAFSVTCSNGIAIDFRDGRYEPETFSWSARFRNDGDAAAPGVRAFILPPPALRLDSLTPSERLLGILEPGRDTALTWLLHVRGSDRRDTAVICATVLDRFNRSATCCDTVIIPPRLTALLEVRCAAAPDSIGIDPASGVFLPADAALRADAQNAGTDNADSVFAEIIVTDPSIRIAGAQRQLLAARLAPGGGASVAWRLAPLPDPVGRVVTVLIRLRASRGEETTTSCALFVAGTLESSLACSVATVPSDTLHYDPVSLTYLPLALRATVRNTGRIALDRLQATALPPPGTGLPSGATAVVDYPGGALPPDSSWSVAWPLEPQARRNGTLDSVGVEFRSSSLRGGCATGVFMVGIPPLTVLSIPVNNVERYGRSLRIPMTIDNTDSKNISRLDVAVSYDASAVRFDGFDRSGALLDSAWTLADSSRSGRLRVLAEADTAVLRGEGNLVFLNFTVLFGLGGDALRTSGTVLRFDSAASSVNRGGVLARYFDGFIIVSGDCLWPLTAGDGYVLLEGSPNPLRGSAMLRYRVAAAGHVLLTVHNGAGATVRTLVDGVLEPGEHRAVFDAGDLPAGAYRCLLRQDGATRSIGIIVLR